MIEPPLRRDAHTPRGYPDEVQSWWATDDFPMRKASRAAFLVDGRMTMLEMCLHFLCAKHAIHITAWGLSPELLLVRGKHHRAGPHDSPEQQELLVWLRAKGLTEPDLVFWQQCEELSVKNILSYAVAKGVAVRVLLWNTYTLPFQPNSKQVQETLEAFGIYCLLDDSHMGLFNHPTLAHHQKTVVVDNSYALIGGIDMMMQNNGEYDRWDTKGHPYHHPLRLGKDGKMPHSWHDVHVLFEGPAVADVEQNFRQRWNALVNLYEMDALLYVHAKVAIVDDEWMTVGSANLNNRGMRDDTEMNVALAHAKLAQGLRILLMAEHLGLCNEDELFRIIEVMGRVQLADERDQVSEEIGSLWTRLQALLGDPFSGMALFAKQAKENLLAVKAGQPLVGHLLPYISSGWAQEYEVSVNSVNGWLAALPQ